jgi:hypothetical protein
MEKTIVDVGTVRLGVEDYRLVRTKEFQQEWTQLSVNEPPWSGASGVDEADFPNMISVMEESWHLGGFKSREGIEGTTEYGTTDNRWPFQMLPGPYVTILTLPDVGGHSPTCFFEALGYIFVLCGHKAFRITPSDLTVVLSKDIGSEVLSTGLLWESTYGVAGTWLGYAWKVTAIVGGGPDTWAVGTSLISYMDTAINRLFKVDETCLLKNVSTGLDPTAEANFADTVQCGSPAVSPNSLVAYQNTVLVGKSEGVFGVSADEGIGVPLVKRMLPSILNCYGMKVVEPYVLVPHSRGLYRLQPGVSCESVGLEQEVLNQTVIPRGRFASFAVDNQWIYAFLECGTSLNSYILVGRNARSGEASLGPIIWDTLIDLGVLSAFSSMLRPMHISTKTPQPMLFFPMGPSSTNHLIGVVKLPVGGGVPGTDCTFAASSVRYSPRYSFGDWNLKDFPKVQIAARGVDATNRYWSLAYSIDGGTFVDVDSAGNPMHVHAEGVQTFYFAATAVGREIQYRWTYTGPAGGDSTPAPLVYFRRYAVPQSKKVPIIKCILYLAAGILHDAAREARDAITQFNDLNVLSEQASSVASYGPWGDNVPVWVRHVQLLQTIQEGQAEPELLVEVVLQKRESS